MRTAILIATREVRERRLIFLAALVAGTIPLLFAPRFGSTRADALSAASITIATAFAVGGALLVGSTIVGRDLADHHISFDLARPAPTIAIWAGRTLAALAIVLGSAIVALVPTTLFGHGLFDLARTSARWVDPGVVGVFAFATVLLTGLAHIAGLDFRARSIWSLIDLIAIPVVVALAWLVWQPILAAHAERLTRVAVWTFAIWCLIAVFVAAAAGFVRGRTILEEVQQWTATSLAILVAFAVITSMVWGVWVRSAAPSDLTRPFARAEFASNSPLVAFVGHSPGRMDYLSTFFINVDTGGWTRVPAGSDAFAGAVNTDGTLFAWGEARPTRSDPHEYHVIVGDLSGRHVERRLAIPAKSYIWSASFSPDSTRLAFTDSTKLRVVDVASGEEVSSVNISPETARAQQIIWLDEDHLRLYASETSRGDPNQSKIRIADVNLAARSVTSLGWCSGFKAIVDSGAHKLLVMGRGPGRLELADARSGEGVATLGTSPNYQSATFVSGGRIAATRIDDGGRAWLDVFASTTALERSIPLGDSTRAMVGGEPVAGRVAVALTKRRSWPPGDDFAAAWQLLVVDVKTGTIERLPTHGYPEAARFWGVAQTPAPGSAASRLMYGEGWKNLVFDRTGTKLQPLLAGH